VIVSPTSSDWETVSQRFDTLVESLDGSATKIVGLDETPELDDDVVLRSVRLRGNQSSAKSLLLSQSPTDVDPSVVKQCVVCWVGPMPETYRPWLRSAGLASHADALASHDPYQWSLLTGPSESDRITFEPVPEAYAL